MCADGVLLPMVCCVDAPGMGGRQGLDRVMEEGMGAAPSRAVLRLLLRWPVSVTLLRWLLPVTRMGRVLLPGTTMEAEGRPSWEA